MCSICGCGNAADPEVVGGHAHDHDHRHGGHDHGHHHHRHDPLTQASAPGPLGGVHAPGIDASRRLRIEADILGENNRFAAANRAFLAARRVFALNLMSSPGSGKTTLLVRTIGDLGGRFPIAVVEGDQQTSLDAERIRAVGVPTLQINTGKGCHLDAHMVGHAVSDLDPDPGALLFIENVGNLVCPAAFDLGESVRVVLLSVTEGDDKPLKYPDMFAAADLVILNKVDLLPYVSFDRDRCFEFARRVRPGIETLSLSATTGEGLDAWYDWIDRRRAEAGAAAVRAEV